MNFWLKYPFHVAGVPDEVLQPNQNMGKPRSL